MNEAMAINNLVRRKLCTKKWGNSVTRRFTTAQPSYGLQRNTKSFSHSICYKKPNHVPNLVQPNSSVLLDLNFFCFDSVVTVNLNRMYSTQNYSEKQNISKFQQNLFTYINIDFFLTVAFFIFLYFDYKKYKKEGKGYVIK